MAKNARFRFGGLMGLVVLLTVEGDLR